VALTYAISSGNRALEVASGLASAGGLAVGSGAKIQANTTSIATNATAIIASGNVNHASITTNATAIIASGNVNHASIATNATAIIASGNVNHASIATNATAIIASGNKAYDTAIAVALTYAISSGNRALEVASGLASGGGSARSVAGDTDNGLMTWVTSDNTFAAEANLTYDGTTFLVNDNMTVGADGTGHDVTLYGDTAGNYLQWDQSADELELSSGTLTLNAAALVTEFAPISDTPAEHGAAVTVDWASGNFHNILLSAAVTKVQFLNATRGQKIIMRVTQDDSARAFRHNAGWNNVNYSVTDSHNATVRWAGSVIPTITTSVNHTDVYGFICTSANGRLFDGFIIGQDLPD
jgi:hypothetical protein